MRNPIPYSRRHIGFRNLTPKAFAFPTIRDDPNRTTAFPRSTPRP
ncbi:hypothetical protein L612_002100000360 [Rhodococcus rhodochrous J38]|nr:hypothetical protein L612_002100000360 [Rhodococcus rhodochrous J38]BDB60911.1 hypothetical protein RDE2_27050 [Rhodococcus sp. RDE2]